MPTRSRTRQKSSSRGAIVKLEHSDQHVLSTIILATVVFFAGLAARLTWIPARLTAIALSAIPLLWGTWDLITPTRGFLGRQRPPLSAMTNIPLLPYTP
jgi:hypothetical protein